ncbi:hypothetical protein MMPV_002381 [Pyropia vietnamensis]
MDVLRSVSRRVRSADAFPKTLDDFRVKTASGGFVSVAALLIICVLVLSETSTFLTAERSVNISVDNVRNETLQIYINVDFPRLNCDVIGVDALDESGNMQLEITNHMYKTRLDLSGKVIRGDKKKRVERNPVRQALPAAKQAELPLGTAAAVMGVKTLATAEYDPSEGCNVKGYIEVLKLSGKFHLTPGHSVAWKGHNLHDMSVFRNRQLDLSHTIRSLSFGAAYPGQKNPLDGTVKSLPAEQSMGQHEYFIKLVPTTYKKARGRSLKTNQYSVTEFFRPSDPNKDGQLLPGVFVFYELSPIRVEYEDKRRSFPHFIVQLSAIVGGVWAMAGMVDTGIFHGTRVLREKRGLGKHI